jgi:hypothetical protein
MNGFTGKRTPEIPGWAQQREFGAFGVGTLGRSGAFGIRRSGAFGAHGCRDVACNVSTTPSPPPIATTRPPVRRPKPPAQSGNHNNQS